MGESLPWPVPEIEIQVTCQTQRDQGPVTLSVWTLPNTSSITWPSLAWNHSLKGRQLKVNSTHASESFIYRFL